MNQIPKEIKQKVDFNLEIANEIYYALEEKGLKPVDLAKKLNKSESEISRWLTGTHNLTIKTILKIADVLDTKILVPYSAKISEYEDLINELREKCEELTKAKDGMSIFNQIAESFQATLSYDQPFNFNPKRKDKAKIKGLSQSDYHIKQSGIPYA
jgi:transcriptional regulator with XRE-family HTH domain